MDPRLQQAIDHDDVDELHRFIVEAPKLLDRACKGPFPNTPLHVAAAAGKTQVAMEMAILKPSFARKLNPEGYSPMHLALQHEHYSTVRALMTLDPKLIRIRGRCGITPLHYVARREGDNELELLAEFLSTTILSIEDLTSRCETAVHVAVKSHNLKAFKVLLGWLKLTSLERILDWKDQDGNTVLHIAVSEQQPKIIKLLIGHTNVNAKNIQDQTALEIFEVNPCDDQDVAKRLRREGRQARRFTPTISLSQAFSMGKYVPISNDQGKYIREVTLIVAALVATATYQAALSPPGGYWQDSSSNPPANSTTANSSDIAIEEPHEAGNLIMTGFKLVYFTCINTVTFFLSIGTIWAMAIPLLPGSMLVCICLTYLGVTYFFSLIIEFPNFKNLPIALLACFYLLFLLAALGLSRYFWRKRVRDLRDLRKIDATRRRVSSFPK